MLRGMFIVENDELLSNEIEIVETDFNFTEYDDFSETITNFNDDVKSTKKLSVKGTAVTGLVFTLTVIFSVVGFVLSLISVIRAKAKKKRNPEAEIKGFAMSVISLVLSIAIIFSSALCVLFVDKNTLLSFVAGSGIIEAIGYIVPEELLGERVSMFVQISSSLKDGDVPHASYLSGQLEEHLTDFEKAYIMNMLVPIINTRLSDIALNVVQKKAIITNDIIYKFMAYQNIVNSIGVKYSDDTNVRNVLSKVIGLRDYTQYNDIFRFLTGSEDYVEKWAQYSNLAFDSFTDYMRAQYFEKALYYCNMLINQTYNYDTSSYGISATRNYYQWYANKIENYLYNGGNITTNEKKDYNEMMSAMEVAKEGLSKIKDLPTEVYYNP